MRALIVYYSRSGVTRRVAEAVREQVSALGVEAVVEEVVDRKDRQGVVGYVAAGKDAMLKRTTEIAPIQAEVASFDVVAIGTPVWAWTIAPAIRAFCGKRASSCRNVAFFCTMGGSGDKGAFKALEELCAKPPVATLALLERDVKNSREAYAVSVEKFAREIAGH